MNALVINCSPVKDGATAEIVNIVRSCIENECKVKCICIDDFNVKFCKGCRTCLTTAKCNIQDDVIKIIDKFEWADAVVLVSPSYWAEMPGQFKVFIDRCTPWCDTHEPHAELSANKNGYSIVLRTGSNIKECDKIIESIEHFYGHMGIIPRGSMSMCSIENKKDIKARSNEVASFCTRIIKV